MGNRVKTDDLYHIKTHEHIEIDVFGRYPVQITARFRVLQTKFVLCEIQILCNMKIYRKTGLPLGFDNSVIPFDIFYIIMKKN